MTVRPATTGDCQQITGLLRRLHPQWSGTFHQGCIRQDARIFVADTEGRVDGVVLATLVSYGVSSYGMIEELIVAEEHRRSGIGRALVEQAMRWFEAEKLEVVFVSAGDHQAAAFYEKVGFERTRGAWLYRVPGEAVEPDGK